MEWLLELMVILLKLMPVKHFSKNIKITNLKQSSTVQSFAFCRATWMLILMHFSQEIGPSNMT